MPGEGTGFGVPVESSPVPAGSLGIPSRPSESGCWHLTGSQEREVSEDAGELGKARQRNQSRRKCWWQQMGWA